MILVTRTCAMPADLNFRCPALASELGCRSTLHRVSSRNYCCDERKAFPGRKRRLVMLQQARHVLYCFTITPCCTKSEPLLYRRPSCFCNAQERLIKGFEKEMVTRCQGTVTREVLTRPQRCARWQAFPSRLSDCQGEFNE